MLAILLMEERIKKAFDAIQDIIKQLITLSVAIIGAIVTFPEVEKAPLSISKLLDRQFPSQYLYCCLVLQQASLRS